MSLQRHLRRASGVLAVTVLGASLVSVGAARVSARDLSQRAAGAGSVNSTLEVVDLDHAKLSVALNLIKSYTGINTVILESGHDYDPVTLHVRNRPVRVVLDLIAKSAGADIWEADGIFFLGPKGSAPKPEPIMERLLPQIQEVSAPPIVYRQKIKLMYQDAQYIVRRLGGEGGLRDRYYQAVEDKAYRSMLDDGAPAYSRLMGNAPVFPATSGSGAQPALINPAQPAVPTGQASNLGSPSTNATPRVSSNGGNAGDQVGNRDAAQMLDEFGRGGQFGGGGNFGGGGQGNTGNPNGDTGLNNRQGTTNAAGGGAAQAPGLLPPSIKGSDLYALDADNSIIVVSSDEAAIQELKRVIAMLDVKPIQIMIRAEFVTASRNDTNAFGIDWTFQKVNLVTGVSTGYTTTNTAFIQYAAGNVQAQMSWLLTTGKGKLVSAPMATTVNNVAVTFSNTTETPIVTQSAFVSQTGTEVITSSVNAVPSTTSLNILPRVNGDGSISVTGSLLVSAISGTVTDPSGNTYPIIISQPVQVHRIIRDGDTMVIGGFVTKNDVSSEEKVPLLSDLPLIGSLFKSHNVTANDQDLLIFITPSIIPERAPNSPVTGMGSAAGGLSAGTPAPTAPGSAGGGLTP